MGTEALETSLRPGQNRRYRSSKKAVIKSNSCSCDAPLFLGKREKLHLTLSSLARVNYCNSNDTLPVAAPGGGGALSTCTYGEVSPIFLGQNIAKSDIFGSKEN